MKKRKDRTERDSSEKEDENGKGDKRRQNESLV